MVGESGSPERRNLMLISFFLILYIWGGGKPTDDTLSFSLIKIEFVNVKTVQLLFFGWFIWACYRYWIKHKENISRLLERELTRCIENSPIIIDHIRDVTKLDHKNDFDCGEKYFSINNISSLPERNYVKICIWEGDGIGGVEKTDDEVYMRDNIGRFAMRRFKLHTLFCCESFSDYIAPIALAIAAFYSVLIKFLWFGYKKVVEVDLMQYMDVFK